MEASKDDTGNNAIIECNKCKSLLKIEAYLMCVDGSVKEEPIVEYLPIEFFIKLIEARFREVTDKYVPFFAKEIENDYRDYCKRKGFKYSRKKLNEHFRMVGVMPPIRRTINGIRRNAYDLNTYIVRNTLRLLLKDQDFDFNFNNA